MEKLLRLFGLPLPTRKSGRDVEVSAPEKHAKTARETEETNQTMQREKHGGNHSRDQSGVKRLV